MNPTLIFDRQSFYAPNPIGETRKLTPEGFLLCENRPIGRIGLQVYSKHELDLEPNASGEIWVERLADEVFNERTIASFEGKAVTFDHPPDSVTPDNWKEYAIGTVQNVRRGTGDQKDLLIADLLITDSAAITYANSNLPELSSGYQAEYEQTEPGRAIQRNIIGNHVALVRRGRAGSRCAIKDGETPVSNKTLLSKILAQFGVKDADAAADVIEQVSAQRPTTDKAPDANPLEQRIAAIETGFAEIKTLLTKQTTDKAKEEEDAAAAIAAAAAAAASKPAFTADALKDVVARAEILSPGIQIPTADALKDVESVEKFMRDSIEKASATDAGKETINTFLAKRELKTLTGDALAGVFNGAAEVTRARNNATVAPNPFETKGNPFLGQTKDGKTLTTADLVREQQKANSDFWSKKAS
jgi:hypothetical protein